MLEGRIIKGIGGFYYVKTTDGIYECKARGRFRHDGVMPMVGDKVTISLKNGMGSIESIETRSSMLTRPPVANINQLVVVVSVLEPEPNPDVIDYFLLMGEIVNIQTVLCINKTDLSADGAIILKSIYEKAGYRIICTSAVSGEGIDKIRELLCGRVTAFAGNSGVGKSSLLNAVGMDVVLKTGEVSDKIKRGRHTTRHVELLELSFGGYVLDTPGFSSLELPDIKAEELELYFREFQKHLGTCRFRGCAHINEPGCTVRAAVEAGEISQQRYESYKKMYDNLKNVREW